MHSDDQCFIISRHPGLCCTTRTALPTHTRTNISHGPCEICKSSTMWSREFERSTRSINSRSLASWIRRHHLNYGAGRTSRTTLHLPALGQKRGVEVSIRISASHLNANMSFGIDSLRCWKGKMMLRTAKSAIHSCNEARRWVSRLA